MNVMREHIQKWTFHLPVRYDLEILLRARDCGNGMNETLNTTMGSKWRDQPWIR